jgi:hypothetical protein
VPSRALQSIRVEGRVTGIRSSVYIAVPVFPGAEGKSPDFPGVLGQHRLFHLNQDSDDTQGEDVKKIRD